MKTSKRFGDAVTKLYNAFHEGELILTDPCFCAVGNMCNNNNEWFEEVFRLKNMKLLNPVNDINYISSNTVILSSGYSAYELGEVERIFATHVGLLGLRNLYNEDLGLATFKGLCAVVEYLCELEGIPNVMDYTCLFETENEHPKYELEKVF